MPRSRRPRARLPPGSSAQRRADVALNMSRPPLARPPLVTGLPHRRPGSANAALNRGVLDRGAKDGPADLAEAAGVVGSFAYGVERAGAHVRAMDVQELTVRTPDGRDLEVLVSGPADATPVVFHSGTPSGPVPNLPMARAADRERAAPGDLRAARLRPLDAAARSDRRRRGGRHDRGPRPPGRRRVRHDGPLRWRPARARLCGARPRAVPGRGVGRGRRAVGRRGPRRDGRHGSGEHRGVRPGRAGLRGADAVPRERVRAAALGRRPRRRGRPGRPGPGRGQAGAHRRAGRAVRGLLPQGGGERHRRVARRRPRVRASVGLRPRRDHRAGEHLAGGAGPDGALRAREVAGLAHPRRDGASLRGARSPVAHRRPGAGDPGGPGPCRRHDVCHATGPDGGHCPSYRPRVSLGA